jgi:hypothetical protein
MEGTPQGPHLVKRRFIFARLHHLVKPVRGRREHRTPAFNRWLLLHSGVLHTLYKTEALDIQWFFPKDAVSVETTGGSL